MTASSTRARRRLISPRPLQLTAPAFIKGLLAPKTPCARHELAALSTALFAAWQQPRWSSAAYLQHPRSPAMHASAGSASSAFLQGPESFASASQASSGATPSPLGPSSERASESAGRSSSASLTSRTVQTLPSHSLSSAASHAPPRAASARPARLTHASLASTPAPPSVASSSTTSGGNDARGSGHASRSAPPSVAAIAAGSERSVRARVATTT
mmetsp:Transcript_15135/g.47066  ORF Transcript_15135/g.47066 Transcript_15135/m.47066 type:complete len:215 (-) Transcript_15135:20-664(-)